MWIALIGEEVGRVERCDALIQQAKNGELEIWTSSLTLAEVYKFKCGADLKQLAQEKDQAFEMFLQQPYVVQIQLDHSVGVHARRLLRAHSPPLKKPNDAIHVASAAAGNVQALYTFDSQNLIPLSGLVQRADGGSLAICEPPTPQFAQQPDMFDKKPS